MEITCQPGFTVVAFKAALISSAEAIAAVSKQINDFIQEKHPTRMIIDFEQVKFFSSAVLGLLISIRARLKTYDGEVVISGINPQLYRVFKITNLDKIFKFFPDRDSAVKAVGTN